MSDDRMHDTVEELVTPIWSADAADRCIVCDRPSNGKAICGDVRCANELANG